MAPSSNLKLIENSFMEAVELKFVRILIPVHNRMHSSAFIETSEIYLGQYILRRQFVIRSFLSPVYGLGNYDGDRLLVPLTPNVTTILREYFKPSFLSVRAMSKHIATVGT